MPSSQLMNDVGALARTTSIRPAADGGAIRARLPALVVLITVLAASALTLLLTGNPVLAALPALVVSVVAFVWMQPLRRTVLPLIFAESLLFTPAAKAGYVMYASGPLWDYLILPGTKLLNTYLNRVTMFSFLSLTGHELAYPLLLIVVAARVLRNDRLDAAERTRSANILFLVLAIELATVVALEAWGFASGGNMRSSLFQIRAFIWLPIQTFVIFYALRNMRDFRAAALAVTVGTLLKAMIGLYFMRTEVWAKGLEAPFMTGHQDSVPYVTVLFCWLAVWLHRPRWRRLLLFTPLFVLLLTAIVANNRRMAWVGLVAAAVSLVSVSTGTLRRRLLRTILVTSPLIVAYLAVSRSVSTGIFAPGATLMGIADVKDASTLWRELENANLIFTIRQHPVFGSGWGHEYVEILPLPSISETYSEYRLIAHNSILWLLSVAGLTGFILLWMPVIVGVFFAARSYRFARNSADRVAACTCVAVMVSYVLQAWGDIGIAAPVPTLLLACVLAAATRLAHDTGAWPGREAPLRHAPGGG